MSSKVGLSVEYGCGKECTLKETSLILIEINRFARYSTNIFRTHFVIMKYMLPNSLLMYWRHIVIKTYVYIYIRFQ